MLLCTDLVVRLPMSTYLKTLNTSQPVSGCPEDVL